MITTAVILGGVLGGCGQSPRPSPTPSLKRPATGTVVGTAAHCAGLPRAAALLPVTVIAREHERVVATQTVSYLKDHDRYRLSLRPGRYTISAPRSADGPQAVDLRSGERAIVDFADGCD